jgi:hypothetical protein
LAIVISQDLILSPAPTVDVNAPVIGWRNVVTATNVTANSQAVDNPAANVANPSTYLKWKSLSTALQFVTVTFPAPTDVDYLGVAGHNFGTAKVAASVEGTVTLDPLNWQPLGAEQLPADDQPMIWRFAQRTLMAIRLRMAPPVLALPPQVAVIYAGKLLQLERRVYVGHKPISFNRRASVVTGLSEEATFLGRLVLGEQNETTLDIKNATAAFYRTDIEPWLRDATRRPFFFAWRPFTYPSEVGFCWLTADPTMTNQRSNGMVQVSASMRGIVQ